MVSAKRYGIVIVLLLAGLLLAQVGSAAADLRTTYDSTRVSPADDVGQIATGDPAVANLDAWVSSMPAAAGDAIATAVENGTFHGDVPPELYTRLSHYENDSTVAAYHGRYYRLNVTRSGRTTETWLTTTPLSPAAAAAAVATPYREASPGIRHAVDGGNASTARFAVGRALVAKDGAYYLVTPHAEGSVVGKFFGALVGAIFQPVARAYVVAGVALLAALRRRGSNQPLDGPTALAAVGGTVALLWVDATLTQTGSLAFRYVVFPAVGAVAALGLLAGRAFRRRSWLRLLALSIASAVGGVVAVAISMGAVGLLLGVPALVAGWFGSLPLAGYGYAFTPPLDESGHRSAPVDADADAG